MSSANITEPSAVSLTMPKIHDAADGASLAAQKSYLLLSRVRLGPLVLAAIAGGLNGIEAINLHFNFTGLVIMLSFVVAGIAELVLLVTQPERTWYSGRAIAESVKTLAWRFAVQGEPFGPNLSARDAEALLVTRTREVISKGGDKLDLDTGQSVVTDSMRRLRSLDLPTRRASYLVHRTENQRNWYSDKAKANARHAQNGRIVLLVGEVVAIAVSVYSFAKDSPFDFAGIVAAAIASVAAWIAIKQYSQITSAYRVAAAELAIQESTLQAVVESRWPQAVADAEEAISREHTMWLASRGEEPIRSGPRS